MSSALWLTVTSPWQSHCWFWQYTEKICLFYCLYMLTNGRNSQLTCRFSDWVGAWVLSRSRDCGSRGKTSNFSWIIRKWQLDWIFRPQIYILIFFAAINRLQSRRRLQRRNQNWRWSHPTGTGTTCAVHFSFYILPTSVLASCSFLSLPSVVPSPSRWILEEPTTSSSSVSWKRKWCHWRDFCSSGIKLFSRRTER